MRKVTAIGSLPAPAQNIEAILDIILMIINVLEALGRLFGIDFSGWFGGGN